MKQQPLKMGLLIACCSVVSIQHAPAATMDIKSEATLLSLLYVPRLNIPKGNICQEHLSRKVNGKRRRYTLHYDQARLLKIVERDHRNRIDKTITFAYKEQSIRVATHYRKASKSEAHVIPRAHGELNVVSTHTGQLSRQIISLSQDEYQVNLYGTDGSLQQKKRYQVQGQHYPAATYSFAGNNLYHTYQYRWEKPGKVMHVTGSSGKLKFTKRDKLDNPLLIKLNVDFDDGSKLRMTEKRRLQYCNL